MSNKKIIRRTYYRIKVNLVSPLNIGNGDGILTDADVVKNSNGEIFVPGSSLAGAFRNYLDENDRDILLGFARGEKGQMSPVWISDLYFDESPVTSVRDQVRLTEEKGVDNKFDMEIVEPGVSGAIRIECVEREGDPDYSSLIQKLVFGIESGEIRIGAKKNRGFGRMRVDSVCEESFDSSEREKWLQYLDSDGKDCVYLSYEEWSQNAAGSEEQQYIRVVVPLKQKGGISIRRYSTVPGKADFEHITSNGKPVIPGSSWNGAIRSDAYRILQDLGLNPDQAAKQIDKWFGCANDGQQSGHQSLVVFSESEIKNAKAVPMTRNKINRFTSGTKDGALYSEISWFGGRTNLEYLIRKKDQKDQDECLALAGLLELVVDDICKGYLAIGGQTAVGRGVFEADGKTIRTGCDDLHKNGLQALYRLIKGETK